MLAVNLIVYVRSINRFKKLRKSEELSCLLFGAAVEIVGDEAGVLQAGEQSARLLADVHAHVVVTRLELLGQLTRRHVVHNQTVGRLTLLLINKLINQ